MWLNVSTPSLSRLSQAYNRPVNDISINSNIKHLWILTAFLEYAEFHAISAKIRASARYDRYVTNYRRARFNDENVSNPRIYISW